MRNLTAERLREVVRYEPKTGLWRYNFTTRGKHQKDAIAGGEDGHGEYWRLTIDGRKYMSHVLAVLYMTGEWPAAEVDHRDTDGLNNRWRNLRDANRVQNVWNRKTDRRNTSGAKGVWRAAGRRVWRAAISAHGKRINLGSFRTKRDARAAYTAKAKELHGEFRRAA